MCWTIWGCRVFHPSLSRGPSWSLWSEYRPAAYSPPRRLRSTRRPARVSGQLARRSIARQKAQSSVRPSGVCHDATWALSWPEWTGEGVGSCVCVEKEGVKRGLSRVVPVRDWEGLAWLRNACRVAMKDCVIHGLLGVFLRGEEVLEVVCRVLMHQAVGLQEFCAVHPYVM